MVDWAIVSVIYLITLILTIKGSAITKHSDRGEEYRLYNQMIAGKRWVNTDLVSSCLFSCYFPSLVYRLIGRGKDVIFRIAAPPFYSLMPVFTYLIAREYFDIWYSVLATAFLLSNFFFLYFNDTGRVGIAQGFLAGLVYGLLINNLYIACVFAVLVVVSHYGTAYLALFILGVTAILLPPSNVYIVCAALGISLLIWHWGICSHTGITCLRVAIRAIKCDTTSDINSRITRTSIITGCSQARKSLRLPSKVELVVSLLVVGLICMGMITGFNGLPPLTKALSIAMMVSIALTLLSPFAAFHYGPTRVYHTNLILLSSLFVVGIKWLADLTGLTGYGIAACVIIIYGLCTSGGLHFILGVNKRGER